MQCLSIDIIPGFHLIPEDRGNNRWLAMIVHVMFVGGVFYSFCAKKVDFLVCFYLC